jgi:hypothetical protein
MSDLNKNGYKIIPACCFPGAKTQYIEDEDENDFKFRSSGLFVSIRGYT